MDEYLDPGPWPGFIGDQREKFVRITLGSGEEIEHSEVYFVLSAGEFVVSTDKSYDDTIRYDKADVARIEVLQYHTACFITSAVADEETVLEPLRRFREEAMAPTLPGRTLLWVYDLVSPPVARTVSSHPDARPTRTIRWLIQRCASLAERREHEQSPTRRRILSLALIVLYVSGIIIAMVGHVVIGIRERVMDYSSNTGNIRLNSRWKEGR